jgi:hypothetical protein
VRAASVFDAIQHAEALKASGAYDLFRGQPRDSQPLRTSLARKTPEEREHALKRISRFAAWANSAPEMAGAHKHELLAVAQHYSIPTNLLDFTTEPRIAGFFASDNLPDDLGDDESSCIICVNSRDLSEYWSSIRIARPELPESLIVRVQIPELWRLQAQRGCFIFLPYAHFERLYSFDRIYFPPHRGEPPVPRDDVYPRQQSSLEAAIDRFLMLEGAQWDKTLLDALEQVTWEAPPHGIEVECFGPEGLPQHGSWGDSRRAEWASPLPELWTEYSKAPSWPIELPVGGDDSSQVTALAATILQRLLQEPEIRRGPVVWRCQDAPYVEEALRLFWDGTRRWPYKIDDLARGVALTAVFAKVVEGSAEHPSFAHVAESLAERCLGGTCIEVEIGVSDGSYTRGYARSDALRSAVRDDFASYLQPNWRAQVRTIAHVVQVAAVPDRAFDFEVLSRVFVTEIVPTQVVLRGERSGKARLYNIAMAATIGVA